MPDLEKKEQEKIVLPIETDQPETTPQQEVVEAEPKTESQSEQKTEAEAQGVPETESRPAQSTPSASIQSQTKDIKKLDRQNQVKSLIDLAQQKGINEAIKVAQELDNAYALDELHDTLVDELYTQLTQQGKLKKL